MSDQNPRDELLSIGHVSQKTGVPVETLRTWERRYGVPAPKRTPSGHRLYAPEVVQRLRMIAEAVQHGERASRMMRLSDGELAARLRELRPTLTEAQQAADLPPARREPVSAGPLDSPAQTAAHWVDLARRLDGDALDAAFRSHWAALGAVRFLAERAGPFIESIGQAWAEARLDIYHEHYASERLRDFLASTWRPLADGSTGPAVLLTTLPGERHALGLHMVAPVIALAGCRITFLGADTPLQDIENGAQQLHARAILLSVSRSANPGVTRDALVRLRARVPGTVEIVVGGHGSPDGIAGVTCHRSFEGLHQWALDLVARHR
jgi:DNA-binding transcriptional MerR regulator/methanogenic corrinoid protein MtbC1